MAETTQIKAKTSHRKPAAKKIQRKSSAAATDDAQTKSKTGKPAYLQKKMAVSAPGDACEQEADRVAEEVSRMPVNRSTAVNRSTTVGEDVQRAAIAPAAEDTEQSLQPSLARQEDETIAAKIRRMSDAEDAAPALMRAEEDEVQTKLQRARDEVAAQRSEDETVQSKIFREAAEPSPEEAPALDDDSEQRIDALRGMGDPMADDVRTDMEEKIGASFSAVRIHTDGEADQLAKKINARAFTVGSDIFFAAGEYAPETEKGRKLLAHELTHVVQQGGGVSSKVCRAPIALQASRDVEDESQEITNTETRYIGPEGSVAALSRERSITIPEIVFPNIPEKAEKTGSQNLRIRKGNVVRDTKQVSEWSKLTTRDGSGLQRELNEKTAATWKSGNESNPVYFLRIGRNGQNFLVGTKTEIRDRVIRPFWRPTGHIKTFDVDHIKEFQLGGHDKVPEGNLWLLESSTNRSAGSKINSAINQKISSIFKKWNSPRKPDVETARDEYNITLASIDWSGSVAGNKENYTAEEISEEAKSMDGVYTMSATAVRNAGLDPGEGQFVVFNNSTGGRARTIELRPEPGAKVSFTDRGFIAGFRPAEAEFKGEDDSYIEVVGMLWGDNRALKGDGVEVAFSIKRMERLPQAGYLNITRAERKIREIFAGKIELDKLSPMQLESVGFDDSGAPNIEGKVITDISFLQNSDIGFFIRGNDLGIEKTFTAGELNTPAPFEIDNASLIVSLSTQRGLAAEGNVVFKIENVGEGNITANVGTSQSFSLTGNFAFDEKIFGEGTNAEVRMAYEDNVWSMGGTITIPQGKVPGIHSATINVDYSESEGFAARGEAELDVPGVDSGTLEISNTEEEGFAIGGEFQLSADTPGIRGGSIAVTLNEREDGSGYAVSARGEAQPDIPGINSNLLVAYDDGAFTAEVTAQYARGMLAGELTGGVTNRTVSEDGQLTDTADPDSPLIVYGGGSLTVQIAPWLQGTAGVEFAPDGEITVIGEIALPDELEIFARREINKSIFNIAVQAPVFPGIVAEVGGGLDATAGIGPGVIDELSLGIVYNPAHEEDTTITGDAHLNIPANAGLRLSVRAGIGLGIFGASATGGLEIGGTLGIEGAAEAGVHVEWTPTTGLQIDARVGVHAQPAFTFDIGGYISVRALGFSVYDETFEFASYTFGSDYRFGLSLPIQYREGEPFDISLDDVEFEIPDINTDQLLRGLIARLA